MESGYVDICLKLMNDVVFEKAIKIEKKAQSVISVEINKNFLFTFSSPKSIIRTRLVPGVT